ncbi:YihY/virulence factor BrkB family protein [Halarchaeum salinum]|uniref:YihY/virulence factor BrkB family protein n=1 Tax=Halarchaeum salinum TaxID=489912 RepID=A0AAV3S7G1_9EURY
MSRPDAVRVVRAVVASARRHEITFLAAGVAYYAFVSLVPLLVLALAIGSALGGDALADYALDAVGTFLTPAGQHVVTETVRSAVDRRGATLAGLALLAWSGLRVFRGLDAAFSRIYGRPADEPLTQQLVDGALVLCAVGVAAALAAAVGVLLPRVIGGFVGELVGTVGLAAALTVVFLPVYHVFPDTELPFADVWPGALAAAIGWTLLADGFRLYVATVGSPDLYGVLGAAVLLITWLYVSGTVIMGGAVLNAVLAGRTDDTATEPDERRVETDGGRAGADGGRTEPTPDVTALQHRVESLERELDEKTVDRDAFEDDLKGYVRSRVRRNHARGWGPYLVMLYGTVMTLGAFYWLDGPWAILAMLVVGFSTFGLYVFMTIVGVSLNALGVPGRVAGWLRSKR